MEIIDTGKMIVQADVGEIDIGHVRKGQSARIFPQAAPGTVLRGRVNSYFQKQLAQESVLPLLGERRLRNLVTVART